MVKTTKCECNTSIVLTHQTGGVMVGWCNKCERQVTDDIIVDMEEFTESEMYKQVE